MPSSHAANASLCTCSPVTSSFMQRATDYPNSPSPIRSNTPVHLELVPTSISPVQPSGSQPVDLGALVLPPMIMDAISSFKEKHSVDIPFDYFQQYNIYWVDELPFSAVDWYAEKLMISEDTAEKWVDHIVQIYDTYKAELAAVLDSSMNINVE